jgi:hypothetical protein
MDSVVKLGLELRLTLARQALYHSSHSASPVLVLSIFKIGSLELFAWSDFKP